MTYEEFEARYEYNPATDRIGGGGFGEVYRAYDNLRKRWVAIKECKVEPHKFSLWREVELVNEMEPHINIARYENPYRFKLGRVEMDYAILKYYEEGSLKDLLKKQPLSTFEKIEIIEGLLHGLAHIHQEGFIHRDFKPGNVLIEKVAEKWVPKITDFGMSKLKKNDGREQLSDSSIGKTIAYAAPEQIQNRPINDSTDLWALGIIVYQMATGKLPFDSENHTSKETYNLEVSKQIISGKLPNVSTIEEPFKGIIERCLVLPIHERANSANDLFSLIHKNKSAVNISRLVNFKQEEKTAKLESSSTGNVVEFLVAKDEYAKWNVANAMSILATNNIHRGYVKSMNAEKVEVFLDYGVTGLINEIAFEKLFIGDYVEVQIIEADFEVCRLFLRLNRILKKNQNDIHISQLSNGRFVLKNASGIIANGEYDELKQLSDSNYAFKRNNKWGVINKQGKIIVKEKYLEIYPYHNGLARVSSLGNSIFDLLNYSIKFGFINEVGFEQIPLVYHEAQDFDNEFAIVMINGLLNSTWYKIDKTGLCTEINNRS
ncbi:MAG: protein kinase [Cytophagaceae bacterium]|nr:protein kinase [Cytophagaceae bacterium]